MATECRARMALQAIIPETASASQHQLRDGRRNVGLNNFFTRLLNIRSFNDEVKYSAPIPITVW